LDEGGIKINELEQRQLKKRPRMIKIGDGSSQEKEKAINTKVQKIIFACAALLSLTIA